MLTSGLIERRPTVTTVNTISHAFLVLEHCFPGDILPSASFSCSNTRKACEIVFTVVTVGQLESISHSAIVGPKLVHFAVSVFFVLSGYVLSMRPLVSIQDGDYAALGKNSVLIPGRHAK
jgi:hypothetical protein